MVTLQETSFKNWLYDEIKKLFGSSSNEYQLLIWCDPDNQWKDILYILKDESFEVWTDTDNELKLRHRLFNSDKKPRVVLIPKEKEQLGFLQVYVDNAVKVIEWNFLEALLRYGAPIPSEMQTKIRPHLAGYVKSWLDEPFSKWKELLSGDDKTLITEIFVLKALSNTEFKEIKQKEQFNLFRNKVIEEYGLSDPKEITEKEWRINSIAQMICTEAYHLNPNNRPNTPKYIIHDKQKLIRLLDLLENWKKRTDFYPHFESRMNEADDLAQIRFWAESTPLDDKVYSSRIVEQIIFQKETESLTKLTPVQLCDSMRKNKNLYKKHFEGFWGKTATNRIQWQLLVEFSEVAEILAENDGIEQQWNTISEVVTWYINKGWEIDALSDNIHRETSNLPGALFGIRVKLQRSHQRLVDKTNQLFSELIDRQGLEKIDLQYSGGITEEYISNSEKTAFLVIDALRYELGKRISENINQGEPTKRALVYACKSTIPTVTPLGMAYALPGKKGIEVLLNKSQNGFSIQDKITGINLDGKSGREKWLKIKYSLTESSFLELDKLMEIDDSKTRRLGRKLFVFSKDFDDEGHQGRLKITGSENPVERYAAAIRKLRTIGYSKIIIVTDHGYFHWDPEEIEIEIKPEGNIVLSSRRYVIGSDLSSNESLKLNVSGSQLECLVPRSVNIYKTYGGMGFFHGGTTLQEYIIPTIIIEWPEKAKKVGVRLIPFSEITSLIQRVEVEPEKVQTDLFNKVDESVISRNIFVKVEDPKNRRILFRSKGDYLVEPRGPRIVIELKNTGEEAVFNSELNLMVCDSDNEATLSEMKVVLKVELDEWA